MLYTGIDYHKKCSVVSTQDATGEKAKGKKQKGSGLNGANPDISHGR